MIAKIMTIIQLYSPCVTSIPHECFPEVTLYVILRALNPTKTNVSSVMKALNGLVFQ